MAYILEIHRCNFVPISIAPLCSRQCRPFSKKKTLDFARSSPKFKLKVLYDASRFPIRDRIFRVASNGHWVKSIVTDESDNLTGGDSKEEGGIGDNSEGIGDNSEGMEGFPVEQQRSGSQLRKRIVFGLAIGIGVGGVVLAGGGMFTVALAAAVFAGAREYFELVRSRGIAVGMTPPPRYVSRVCSVICALMPMLTLYFGHIDVSVTSAAFVVAMALLLQRGNPRFAQLSSAMFGLFYCGYLPCFWVKLRCGLAAPALNTRDWILPNTSTFSKYLTEIGSAWPVLLGGPAHWTVGLVATLISFSSIIAADTFAYLGGKTFGRTPLINISPKKTWEGAVAGLSGCIITTLILSKFFCWPTSLPSAAAFGFLNFVGSLFGDLIESMIKRDAGVKDSGSLIPGHGGILDRVDSYIFTGALAYSFVKTFLPLYGV